MGVEGKMTSVRKWSDAWLRKEGESFDAHRHLSEFILAITSLSVDHVLDLVLRILAKTLEHSMHGMTRYD